MTTNSAQRPSYAGPVTRSEIAAAVGGAFGAGAVHRDQILAFARGNAARQGVLDALNRLPAYRYHTLAQVWEHLPRL